MTCLPALKECGKETEYNCSSDTGRTGSESA